MENEKTLRTPNDVQETNKEEQELEERLFTKDEVNDIVKRRLDRQKKSIETVQRLNDDYEERLKSVDDRETAVELREKRIECKEFLSENGYPKELLLMLDVSDPEQFKKNAEALQQAYSKILKQRKPLPLASNDPSELKTPRGGFENTKHKPKQWEYRKE